MSEHGHLFFRGLLPASSVLDARAEALKLCRDVGWIDADGSSLEARAAAGMTPPLDASAEWMDFYRRWIELPNFNGLPEHPAIVSVTEKLLGDSVLVHPRKIGRIGFPSNEGHQTRTHQDFQYIRGTTETYTAWVPLGDCPQRLGSLVVADGSHKLGFREHRPSAGPGGLAVDAEADSVWRSQDFAAGDVLIFHSLTMHRALPNRTEDELRISLDNRYQRVADDVDPGSLRPHI